VAGFKAAGQDSGGTFSTAVPAPAPSPPSPTTPAAPTLGLVPPATTADTTATFAFSDATADVTFVCALDGAAAAPCSSPMTYSGLAAGTHTFAVQAQNGTGSSTAATFSWEIAAGSPPPANTTPLISGVSVTAEIPHKIRFTLASDATVSIDILSATGSVIRHRVVDRAYAAGARSVGYACYNDAGRRVTGTFRARVRSDSTAVVSAGFTC
jgi:hypothetical protein